MYIPLPTPMFIPTAQSNTSESTQLPDWLSPTLAIMFEVIILAIFLVCLIYGIRLIKERELCLGIMLLIHSLILATLFYFVLFGFII